MPVVRRAERQVGIAALPSVRTTAAATEASEGAGRERAKGDAALGFAGFGARVARLGAGVYGRIQQEAREAAHQTALLKANNQLAAWKHKALYDPKTGAFTKKGEAAQPIPEELRAQFEQVAGAIEAGLATPEQRGAFARLRSQEWQGIDLQIRRHVFDEATAFQSGELKGLVVHSTQAAIGNALDPMLVGIELKKAVSAIETSGPRLGMGSEAIAREVNAVRSQVHVGVIGSLLAQNKEKAAAAYFEAARGQISGDKLAGVMNALEEGSLRGASQQQADAIIAKGGTLTEQRAAARAIDDPTLRDMVQQRIEHEAAVNERAERETTEATMRDGYNILDRTPDVTTIPPAQWVTYSGATRSAMRSYAEQRTRGTPVETDLGVYYGRMQEAGDNPAAFVTRNLLEDRHQLGESEFKQLTSLQLSMKNGDRNAAEKELAPFRTRTQLVDDTLALHGINPSAKPDTPEGKAIAQLRRMLDRRVDLLQGGGVTAKNADIQAEIDGLLSQQVTVPGSWWNIFPGGKSVSDTRRRLLDLTIADVPATDRQQIEAALRARQRPVSDAAVLDLYLEGRSRRR